MDNVLEKLIIESIEYNFLLCFLEQLYSNTHTKSEKKKVLYTLYKFCIKKLSLKKFFQLSRSRTVIILNQKTCLFNVLHFLRPKNVEKEE